MRHTEWASKADIIIHTASADDDKATFSIVDGLTSRPKDAPRAIYIQTSGNDELVNSAKGMSEKTWKEKQISDVQMSEEEIEKRIAKDAYHRHVDGPLREKIFNAEKEKEHNVVGSIMMPPLIYGIGSEPWKRISIQTPMLASYMIKNGLAQLPEDHPTGWNQVWVHDLVEEYILLLAHLETKEPGEDRTRYVFPAQEDIFLWKDHFSAVRSEIQRLGIKTANEGQIKTISSQKEMEELVGGLKENPYATCFGQLVFGKENSFTRPDLMQGQLGFKFKAKSVIDSILEGKELEKFLLEQKKEQ